MYCAKCGSQIREGASFCNSCGNQAGAQSEPQQPIEQQTQYDYQQQQPPSVESSPQPTQPSQAPYQPPMAPPPGRTAPPARRAVARKTGAKKKPVALICIIAAVVVALGAGAYFLFFHGDNGGGDGISGEATNNNDTGVAQATPAPAPEPTPTPITPETTSDLSLSLFEPVEIDLAGRPHLYSTGLAAMVESGEIPANVTSLRLGSNSIIDISPLAGLTNLTSLDLRGNPISDWSPVDHVEEVWGRP